MKYLFLNSYFNAIEKHVADSVDFDRMINSPDWKKAFEVLQDTDYGKWALETKSLEKIFESEKEFFARELERMGAGQLVDLYSLRADIVNLRIFLKDTLFNYDAGPLLTWGKSEKELQDYFASEIEKAKEFETPAEMDDYIFEVYLGRLEKFGGKEKEVARFLEDYKESLESEKSDLQKIEDDFIAENCKKNEGLAPILAFFMKKWKAEKIVRTIMTGKEIGLKPVEIKKMIEDIKAL